MPSTGFDNNSTDAIKFDCQHCEHTMKVKPQYAGRKARCKACGEPVRVPDLADGSEEFAEPIDETGPSWFDQVPKVESTLSTNSQKFEHTDDSFWEVVKLSPWLKFAGGGIIVAWVAFLAMALFGIDLFPSSSEYSEPGDKPSATGLFIMALGFTAVLSPIAWISFQRTKGLLSRGIEIPYEIIKYGAARQKMQDVKLQYSFNDKSYRKSMTIEGEFAKNGFRLFVDPEHPKSVLAKPEQ